MLSKDAVQGKAIERVAVKDTELVYRACTSSFAHTLGLQSPAHVIGNTDFDLFPAAIAQQQMLLDRRALTSGEADISGITLAGQGQRQLILRTPILSARSEVRGLDLRMLVGPANAISTEAATTAVAAPVIADDEIGAGKLQGSLVFRRGRPLFANPAAVTILGFTNTADLLNR